MRFAVSCFLVVLMLAMFAPAQAVQPNDDVHVDLSAAYSLVNSAPSVNGSDSVSATVVTVRMPITDRFAVRYQSVLIPPSNAQINFAEVEYRRSVGDFLKSKDLRIDPAKYDLFVYGGAGGKREDDSKAPAFSFIVGGGLDYRINGTLAIRAVDIAYVRTALEKNGFILSNHMQFAPGVSIRF